MGLVAVTTSSCVHLLILVTKILIATFSYEKLLDIARILLGAHLFYNGFH